MRFRKIPKQIYNVYRLCVQVLLYSGRMQYFTLWQRTVNWHKFWRKLMEADRKMEVRHAAGTWLRHAVQGRAIVGKAVNAPQEPHFGGRIPAGSSVAFVAIPACKPNTEDAW